jgi:hypothetical protein
VPANRVLHPPLTELTIGADHSRLMLRSPHRQLIIPGARQASRTRCPALMTTLPQHASHRGIHIVIKQEPH